MNDGLPVTLLIIFVVMLVVYFVLHIEVESTHWLSHKCVSLNV